MENLHEILSDHRIAQIDEMISEFVHSADGYENKLKLVFVLLGIISECSTLLETISSEDFNNEVRTRISELGKKAESMANSYHAHISQNKEVYSVLVDSQSDRIGSIENQIDELLREYDVIIKGIVETRDLLPLETQIKTGTSS